MVVPFSKAEQINVIEQTAFVSFVCGQNRCCVHLMLLLTWVQWACELSQVSFSNIKGKS